jgi:hypothetical protein
VPIRDCRELAFERWVHVRSSPLTIAPLAAAPFPAG